MQKPHPQEGAVFFVDIDRKFSGEKGIPVARKVCYNFRIRKLY